MTEQQEPYESRDSRTDLWGPRGEIPLGYPANPKIEFTLIDVFFAVLTDGIVLELIGHMGVDKTKIGH